MRAHSVFWVGRVAGILLLVASMGATVALAADDPLDLDQFGGYRALRAPGRNTGFFRLERLGNRWVFVTPEGSVFWLRSVYSVAPGDGGRNYAAALRQKYGSPQYMPWQPFSVQAIRRLRSWHFNALGEYTTPYMLPVSTYNRPPRLANEDRMPFIRLIRPSWYGLVGGVFKEIISGTDRHRYTGWRGGRFPDVFDPAFETFAAKSAADAFKSSLFNASLASSPWLIGTTIDDGDDTWGFGQSRESLKSHYASHLGWIAAATAPSQDRSRWSKIAEYSDKKVYTKHAFRDFLREKYTSLAALNAAWGANYTTWDSDGGWPTGSGVLDESGHNRWMGKDFVGLLDAAPQVRSDLDAFLEVLAERYFSVLAKAVRSFTPNHLVFGPASIGAGARPQILRAAARHVDAVQVWMPPDRVDLLQKAYAITQKPVFVWSTLMGQADSPVAGRGAWGAAYDHPTQSARGHAYSAYLQRLVDLKGADGTNFVVGIDWWAWTDKVTGGERTNFGLVTGLDNAYDGKEAIAAAGKDAWGYPTGLERTDYGDFLTHVMNANVAVGRRLLEEFGRPDK